MIYQESSLVYLACAGGAGKLVSSDNNTDNRNHLSCYPVTYKLGIGMKFKDDYHIILWCCSDRMGDKHYITIYNPETGDRLIRTESNNADLISTIREFCISMRYCFDENGIRIREPCMLLFNSYCAKIRSLVLDIADILFASVKGCDNLTTPYVDSLFYHAIQKH